MHILKNSSAGKDGKNGSSKALIHSTKSSLLPLLISGKADITKVSILFSKEGKA
jgi:hypothetical protein